MSGLALEEETRQVTALRNEAQAYLTVVQAEVTTVETRANELMAAWIRDPGQADRRVDVLRSEATAAAQREIRAARAEQAAAFSVKKAQLHERLRQRAIDAQRIPAPTPSLTNEEVLLLDRGQQLVILESRKTQRALEELSLLSRFKGLSADDLVVELERATQRSDRAAMHLLDARLAEALPEDATAHAKSETKKARAAWQTLRQARVPKAFTDGLAKLAAEVDEVTAAAELEASRQAFVTDPSKTHDLAAINRLFLANRARLAAQAATADAEQ